MKAKDLLKEIVKSYPDVVAIAKDSDSLIVNIDNQTGAVYIFFDDIPTIRDGYWMNINDTCREFGFPNIIEWDFKDWTKCIVTLNDIENEQH